MKRSWKCTEFLIPLVFSAICLIKFWRGDASAFDVSLLFSIVFNGLLISRTIAKVSRGIEHKGVAELQSVGYQALWNVIANEAGWLAFLPSYLFIAGAVAVYAVCRGLTKRMTARTQVFLR